MRRVSDMDWVVVQLEMECAVSGYFYLAQPRSRGRRGRPLAQRIHSGSGSTSELRSWGGVGTPPTKSTGRRTIVTRHTTAPTRRRGDATSTVHSGSGTDGGTVKLISANRGSTAYPLAWPADSCRTRSDSLSSGGLRRISDGSQAPLDSSDTAFLNRSDRFTQGSSDSPIGGQIAQLAQ
jgi:hypothetical protein